MNRKQFLEYCKTAMKKKKKSQKVFMPNESWPGPEEFARRWCKLIGGDEDWYKEGYEIAKKWEDFGWNNIELNSYEEFSLAEEMKSALYPKQIIDIIGVEKYRDLFDKFYPEFRLKNK